VRASSIGVWSQLLSNMVWLSVLTNVFLFGFTTDQIFKVFPSLTPATPIDPNSDPSSPEAAAAPKAIAMVFLVEHVLLLVLLVLQNLIPPVPEDVETELRRRQRRLLLLGP